MTPYRDAKPLEIRSTWVEEWIAELVKAHEPPSGLLEKIDAPSELERFLRQRPPICASCQRPVGRLSTAMTHFGRQLEIVAECHGARDRRLIDGRALVLAQGCAADTVTLVDRILEPYFQTFERRDIDPVDF